jgi:S-adenosylhomocysteine hydrolase
MNNFGKVQKMYNGFQAMWYTTDAELKTRDGFSTRKEANAFLKASGITVLAWKDFNRKSQFRK